MGSYADLISTIFNAVDAERRLHNRAVAFTSALPDEDASRIMEAFAEKLVARTQKRVVMVDASAFHDLQPTDANQVLKQCMHTNVDNLLILSTAERAGGSSSEKLERIPGWHSTPQVRQAYLRSLCGNFDYVLIQCPALSESSDVKALAPIVDGVVVVVGTNGKRRRRVQPSHHLIEKLGGKFLGYILK